MPKIKVGKMSRRLGIGLTTKGQRILERRPYGPGQHGPNARRPKPSEYSRQLLENAESRSKAIIADAEKRSAQLVQDAEERLTKIKQERDTVAGYFENLRGVLQQAEEAVSE